MDKYLFTIAALFLFAACTPAPSVIGKWKAIGEPGTLEFHENGSVEMVDNMGATLKGSYVISRSGNVKLIFTHSDILNDHIKPMDEPETVNGKIYVQKNELTLTSPETKEVLRYRR
jgi:hypothetical protein